MTPGVVSSWGRVLRQPHQLVAVHDRAAGLPAAALEGRDATAGTPLTMLPYGNGRSYGDSNLNPGAVLLQTRGLDRVIDFDPEHGTLNCEAGVLLSDILALCVPHGWFVPVAPGTQFITVGGAIANDVHGKNHHRAGSFGHHLLQFELLRSDGSRRRCSPQHNADWFAATVGGLGLTGLVTWARLRLRRIGNPCIDSETIRFRSLEEFFALSAESEREHEYAAAWIDCAAAGKRLGRGLFSRGNHAPAAGATSGDDPAAAAGGNAERPRRMPITPPFSLVNALSLKAFNLAYFHRQRGDRARSMQHYRPFLFPLDAVLDWNRLYGPRGFYQYQCVVPGDAASVLPTVQHLLQTIAASGLGSFLAVLKQFGAQRPAGLLSFPMRGTTLALDFPNRGAPLHRLFEALDAIVLGAGGRLYPAKDGRMSAALFQAGYPRWREFIGYVDPRFSSAFWRRVMAV